MEVEVSVSSSSTFILYVTSFFLCEHPGCSVAAKELVRAAHWSEPDHMVPLGGPSSGEQEVHLEKQLERFEWQLRLLKGALTAGGKVEWAELLRHHADQEVCAVVLSFLEKVSAPPAGAGAEGGGGDFSWCEGLTCSPQVKTETTVDLNVLHEQKSKAAAEEHERNLEGN